MLGKAGSPLQASFGNCKGKECSWNTVRGKRIIARSESYNLFDLQVIHLILTIFRLRIHLRCIPHMESTAGESFCVQEVCVAQLLQLDPA